MPMYQLGIDVSKNTLDLCLLREGIKGRIKTRKLKNTADAAKVVDLPLYFQTSVIT